jgi:transmembrane sensor
MSEFDSTASVTEQASYWWLLLSEGAPSAAENRAFAEWVVRSPERVEAFLHAARLTSALRSGDLRWPRTSAADLICTARTPHGEIARLPSARRTVPRKRPALLAAVVAGAVVTGLCFIFYQRAQRFETAIGEQRSVLLADGSLVTLNTSSSIEVRMERNLRTVQLLSGEALFEVARDTVRPFDVVAGRTTVRAVGTRFDVDRRRGTTTVIVVEGKVLVSDTGANGLPLTAGEQMTLGAHAKHLPVRADTTNAVAWTQRKLIFAHRQLADVAAEFNRYNRQSIEIRGAQLRNQEISGVFQANDPASFLTFLSRLPDVHIQKSPDNLHFIVTLESHNTVARGAS